MRYVSVRTTNAGPISIEDSRRLRAWRGFVRVQSELINKLDAELTRTHSLSLSAFEVLLFLQDAPKNRIRMSELAESVLLTPSGMTRLVDKLESEQLVERERCEDDARGSFAVLTPAGKRLVRRARRTQLAWIEEHFLSHFAPEELEQLDDMWERLLPGATA